MNILADAIDQQEADWKNRVIHDFKRNMNDENGAQVLSQSEVDFRSLNERAFSQSSQGAKIEWVALNQQKDHMSMQSSRLQPIPYVQIDYMQ